MGYGINAKCSVKMTLKSYDAAVTGDGLSVSQHVLQSYLCPATRRPLTRPASTSQGCRHQRPRAGAGRSWGRGCSTPGCGTPTWPAPPTPGATTSPRPRPRPATAPSCSRCPTSGPAPASSTRWTTSVTREMWKIFSISIVFYNNKMACQLNHIATAAV